MFVFILDNRGTAMKHKKEGIVIETMEFIVKNDWNICTYTKHTYTEV